jgi:hypothetical protein
MMILDLDRNGSGYAIGSPAFATGVGLTPPTAALAASIADTSPHPPDTTDPPPPLSSTATDQRSRRAASNCVTRRLDSRTARHTKIVARGSCPAPKHHGRLSVTLVEVRHTHDPADQAGGYKTADRPGTANPSTARARIFSRASTLPLKGRI